jgi:8-amino-7-oxononanoate synthase
MASIPFQYPADLSLNASLQNRRDENALRELTVTPELIDLSSNDYLGLARSQELAINIEAFIGQGGNCRNGSTGSRLLTGNTAFAEELEKYIAGFHRAEAALLFNSGYDANLGLLSCIAGKGDTIIYDELSHASVHDGLKMSRANSFRFRHNDPAHLEERLKAAAGNVFVVIESVYSMDGDLAPLEDMASLCRRYNASLIVDEAHATGVFGANGEGRVSELGLEKDVFARVHTFGKALGVHGAAVVGSRLLRNYLVNFSRPFIYTTALPFHSHAAIQCAYRHMQKSVREREKLFALVKLFRDKCSGDIELAESPSPVQCVIIPGNPDVKKCAAALKEAGFDVRPILSPTVPKGKERLRVCFHSFNTSEEVTRFADSLINIRRSLSNKKNLII